MHSRLAPQVALDALDARGGLFAELFRHGSLSVELYRPIGADHQTPHTRDELYVIMAGTGDFVCAGERRAFVAGEVLFVAAGIEHRFERFSADFCTWVFFYGPEGGERATT
jgi:hypothetical protein